MQNTYDPIIIAGKTWKNECKRKQTCWELGDYSQDSDTHLLQGQYGMKII